MSREKSMSWMPLYVNDWLGSKTTLTMTNEQRGAYITLLIWQWQSEDNSFESIDEMSTLCGLDLNDAKHTKLLAKFQQDDGWYNAKAREVWTTQKVKFDKMVEGGRKGGLKGGLKGGVKQPDPEPEPINTRTKKFIPPTPKEVEEYSSSIGYPMDGQAWCDAYAQKDWKVGKNKMKDWKCAVRNWKAQGWLPSKPKHGHGKGLVNGAVI